MFWGREEHSVLEGGKGKCLCFGVERRGGRVGRVGEGGA